MPVQTTYPGVYVIEEPSGVRTIAGVSTSVATFIGRTKMGPLNEPMLCLNFSDFERTFSADTTVSEMTHSVRLFFMNGGTQCYIVRIANGATKSSITLKNEAGTKVLTATAKSAGVIGDTIRLAVTYNGSQPETLFNLDVFRWVKNVRTNTENWFGLSMDPNHPRYAAKYVNQNSKLIDLTDLLVAPAASGYSQSGPIPTGILNAVTPSKQFHISVNGNPFVNVDLGGAVIDLSVAANVTAIQAAINNVINPESVIVTATAVGTHTTLNIASANGKVFIQPALTDDISGKLMLGTGQGGIEVSKYSGNRPAANGIVFNITKLAAFSILRQDAFNSLRTIPPPATAPAIALGTKLQTQGAARLMYEDNITGTITGNSDGVREKWAIIADIINGQRDTDPTFPWAAEVWGARLAVMSTNGVDNNQGTLTTAATNIGNGGSSFFIENTRYYSLGTLGTGSFQTSGIAGNDGTEPQIQDYRNAFIIIDKEVDIFNLLILPRDANFDLTKTKAFWGEASAFCQKRRAFLLMDGPDIWDTVQKATNPTTGVNSLRQGLVKDHSAVFYPRLKIQDNGLDKYIGATGAIAGLMARTDSSRGVWKAPAGTEADIRGISGLEYRFSDGENGVLNPHAVNTLRIFPNGIVNWGARTMDGDDDFGSEYKYIPIRRTALFIEESLYRGLKWVVFEPNDEPLWAQIRLNVGAFMHNLFRQGAFQGQQKKEAYFVKCDRETTTQNDINLGIVNVWVGFAPLKPAEFVILHLQQMTGQIQV